MWQMIPNDFNVALISEVGDRRLYVGQRELIWHFVKSIPGVSSQLAEGHFSWDIDQSHLPRYSVANAVMSLKAFNNLARDWFSPDDRVVTHESQCVGIYSRGPESYDIGLLETESGWPAEVVKLIEEDIDILERCKTEIESQDDLFILPNVKTPAGYSVESDCNSLIQAIAFERAIRGSLDPTRISAFAAYCVWRDVIEGQGLSRSYYEQLVDNQFRYNAEEFLGSPFLDLVMDVQTKMFSQPIWGIVDGYPIAINKSDATDVLMDAMANLNGIQLTQFWLMDQLHSAGLYLPLAQVIGTNSWQQYMIWKSQGFQPDSDEEQSLREETSFIKMIGDMASEY